jgi:hypothetical protein
MSEMAVLSLFLCLFFSLFLSPVSRFHLSINVRNPKVIVSLSCGTGQYDVVGLKRVEVERIKAVILELNRRKSQVSDTEIGHVQRQIADAQNDLKKAQDGLAREESRALDDGK